MEKFVNISINIQNSHDRMQLVMALVNNGYTVSITKRPKNTDGFGLSDYFVEVENVKVREDNYIA